MRPGTGWKGALAKARVSYPSYSSSIGSSTQSSSTGEEVANGGGMNGHRPTSAGNTGLETPDEPQEVLHSCRKDMMLLWNDGGVRDILRRRKIRPEEGPGL